MTPPTGVRTATFHNRQYYLDPASNSWQLSDSAHNAPKVPLRSVYRVSYYVNGQPKQDFVCAESEQLASHFLGVRDGTASVSTIASNVEVVGTDPAHADLPALPINVAPPEPPSQLNDSELAKLRELLAKVGNPAPQTRWAPGSQIQVEPRRTAIFHGQQYYLDTSSNSWKLVV